MDEKLLAIVSQLAQIEVAMTRIATSVQQLVERVEKNTTDLGEFSERFEEVISEIENERRIDRLTDYN